MKLIDVNATAVLAVSPMVLRLVTAFVVASALAPLTGNAQYTTYNVDLSGIDGDSGHELSVFGTITLDPSLPVGSAIESSNLHFQHLSDTPIAMSSIPTFLTEIPAALRWSTNGNRLYIDRRFMTNSFLTWDSINTGATASLIFASGLAPDNAHQIGYSAPSVVDIDTAVLKPAGGVDAPNGFLVGTIVPEPSTAILLAALGAAFSMRRRRRKANSGIQQSRV